MCFKKWRSNKFVVCIVVKIMDKMIVFICCVVDFELCVVVVVYLDGCWKNVVGVFVWFGYVVCDDVI